MKTIAHCIAVLIALTCIDLHALSLGDTQRTVRSQLGMPQSFTKSGDSQTYRYADGTTVYFEGGVVVNYTLPDGNGSSEVVAEQTDLTSAQASTGGPAAVPPAVAPPPENNVPLDAEPVYVPASQPKRVLSQQSPVSRASSAAKSDSIPLLLILAGLVMLVAQIWFIIAAFSESALWGLGVLFVPFISFIFTVTHWERAKAPFLLFLCVGMPLGVVATILTPQ